MTTDVATSAPTTAASPRPRRRRRRGGPGLSVLYVVLAALAFVYIYPFLIQLATSFKTDADAANNPLAVLPDPFSTAAYSRLFLNSDYPLWFRNSVVVTLLVTVGRVFVTSMAGYALARLKFRGRGAIFAGIVAVMAVPGVVLLIPKFLVLRELGMYNTYSALVVPLLADAAGVFIMKNFFESIPASVEEAARIDGAGTFRLWWSVVLPMAVPAIITITILAFQGSWNELSHFIVASQDPQLVTLTKGVAQLTAGQLGQGTQYPLKLGAAVIMTIPVAVLFFVFQRRIMDTSTGAVKG